MSKPASRLPRNRARAERAKQVSEYYKAVTPEFGPGGFMTNAQLREAEKMYDNRNRQPGPRPTPTTQPGPERFQNLRNRVMPQSNQAAQPGAPLQETPGGVQNDIAKPFSPVASPTQPQTMGPEQQMKDRLLPLTGAPESVPPMGQPQQAMGAQAPDSSAIDQQIAALQKQIADLQAKKK